MAEQSHDHPAFTWLLRLLDLPSPTDIEGGPPRDEGVTGRWVVSDGERAVASGTDLRLVLREIADQPPERFAIAFLRASSGQSGPGDWNFDSNPLEPAGSGGSAMVKEYGVLHADKPR